MQLLEEEGWVSHQYTIKEPRPAFCFNINKTGDNPVIRYVTLLVPYKDRKPDIKVRILNESEKEPISKMNLEITENSSKKMIQYNL
jgi:heparan-sulfate lyase